MENTKNARRKLEFPMEAGMPCKKGTKKRSSFQETEAKSCESNKIPKTKHVCIVKVHESTRQRLESSLSKHREDHIAGKGYNSMTHYNLVHKFIPILQAMKIPDAKVQWTRIGRSSRQSQHGNWRKSREKRRLFSQHKETNIKSTFSH